MYKDCIGELYVGKEDNSKKKKIEKENSIQNRGRSGRRV
jgi:hypothetical protein